MLSGSWMPFSSTKVTATPHSTVLASKIASIEIDPGGLGQRPVQGLPAHHLGLRCVGDLVDDGINVTAASAVGETIHGAWH